MGLIERNRFISNITILVAVFFFGKGACDSICPNGITNITASTGFVAYPESGTYGVNETKCWMIEVPETYRGIYWTYSRFDIENCESCECDSLRTSSSYNALGFAGSCGRFSEGYLEYLRLVGDPTDDSTSSTTRYIRFVSDETVHYKGFNLTFIAQSYTGGRTSYLNATEDETIEFGTPKAGIQKYREGTGYEWFLIVPEGRQVQIDFDIFELEDSENCKNDYVEFREAAIAKKDPDYLEGHRGPILTGRLCGSTKPKSIQSSGNMVWVRFDSDSNSTTVYKGFKASFKAGQGRLSVDKPMALLFLSALLMIATTGNGLF